MNRRKFLAAACLLALTGRVRAAPPLLFHEHGHGLAFSSDGRTLLAPNASGLSAYEDGEWWEAPGPPQGFSGFSVAEHAIYASGQSHAGGIHRPAGLLRSLDGGRTWHALALAGEADFALLAAGYRSGAIYVLNSRANSAMPGPGLFMTPDEGRTWRSGPARGLAGEVHALAAHPRRPEIVAAGTGLGLYLSRDAGERFVRLERGEPVTAAAFDHEGELLLYAHALSNELVERSLAGSARRTVRLPHVAGDYPTCLAHSPVDDRTIAFATRRRDVYLSRDGGRTWMRLAKNGERETARSGNHG